MYKSKVSVILPIRNEENFIKHTLDSIYDQDYGHDNMEVIIVDGLSTDKTLHIIKNFQSTYNNITILENCNKIVPSGFNLALNIAKGEIIIRVDGHSIISRDYVSRCVELLKTKKASNVGGLINPISHEFFGKVVASATSSRFGIGNSEFHYIKKAKWAETVYLGAWKRNIFELVGGFDEDLVRNQDDEFNFRTIQNGAKIWLDPSIKSDYFPRLNMVKLFKQYYQYGFYKVRVIQKRRAIASIRHIIPSMFVLTLLVTYFMKNISTIPFILIISSYCILNLFFSIYNSFSIKGFSKKFLLKSQMYHFVVFFTLHISYGIGFIFGCFYFFKKWGDHSLNDRSFDLDLFKKNS